MLKQIRPFLIKEFIYEKTFIIFIFFNATIATDEAKTFNQKFYIYPNLPYVLLFKERGKVVRYLKSECVNDSSCFSNRLDLFNN